jgi:hypothetical protein
LSSRNAHLVHQIGNTLVLHSDVELFIFWHRLKMYVAYIMVQRIRYSNFILLHQTIFYIFLYFFPWYSDMQISKFGILILE